MKKAWYKKEKEAAWIFFLLNNNDPVFLHPNFFQGLKLTQDFKTRIVGADWLGNYVSQFWRKKSDLMLFCVKFVRQDKLQSLHSDQLKYLADLGQSSILHVVFLVL